MENRLQILERFLFGISISLIKGGSMLDYTANGFEAAPLIEPDDLNRISEFLALPDRFSLPDKTVLTIEQGLGVMENHFLLTERYETDKERIAKERKKLLRYIWNGIICFVILMVIGAVGVYGFIHKSSSEPAYYVAMGAVPFGLFLMIIIIPAWIFRFVVDCGKSCLYKLHREDCEKQLKAICVKMNADYYSAGLAPSHQTAEGAACLAGSIAAVNGLISSAKDAIKNDKYKDASVVVSYCQIADYFNRTYIEKMPSYTT